MTRLPRHILIGAAAGILGLCCVLYAGTQDIFLRPAAEAFVDQDTLLEFPARIDVFQKVRVRKNQNPVFGTVVSYENEEGRSSADVYIYSLDTGATAVSTTMFEQHCRETDRDILDLPKPKPDLNISGGKIRSSVHIEAPGRTAPRYGFEAHYRIRNGSILMDSVLYLALYRGKLVKTRVSYPADDREEARAAYRFVDAVAAMVAPPSGETEKQDAAAENDAPQTEEATAHAAEPGA